MTSGLPRLPEPEGPERPAERRCASCGGWNHRDEARCYRCGRRLDASLGARTRRDLEESEALPFQRIHDEPPPPLPEPAWKQELSERLAGYRARQTGQATRIVYQGSPEDETLPLQPAELPARSSSSAAPATAPIRERGERHERPPSLPPPARQASERAELPPPEGRRPALPPIVDAREAAGETRRPAGDPRPRIEDLIAPLPRRLTAAAMDMGLAALGLGAFLLVVQAIEPEAMAQEGAWKLAAGVFVGLLAFYWLLFVRYLGATAGMLWTGLRLVNFDGRPPDEGQRRARAAGTLLSAAALGLGFLWSLIDEQKLSWHDRVSRTLVAEDGDNVRAR